MKYKNLALICSLFGSVTIITACNNSSTSNSPTYASVTVPTTTYANKFAIYTNVGNAESPVLTELDTGSTWFIVESEYVGPNIVMTNQTATYTYQHGTNPRTGTIGYTSISLLNGESGTSIVSTNNLLPVLVVPAESVNAVPRYNHAIMGLRMNNNTSAKLYLPYPYNQSFILNVSESQLIFGNFTNQELSNFGTINLAESTCNNSGSSGAVPITSSNNSCWNDMAIPVNYTISGSPNGTYQYNSLFDSGAGSSFQYLPWPSWITYNSESVITNTISSSLTTSSGNIPIYLTPSVEAVQSNYNGGIVNVGNNIFNYYSVLFNQQNGTIGLASN